MFQTEETTGPRRRDWERKGHLVSSGGCVGLEGRGGCGGMGREEMKIEGSNGREGPAGLDVRQWEDSKGF